MKSVKKARAWVALVLTFALVTGLAAPAYASAETKGSVTIQQETADAAQGVYKLVVKAQSSVANITTAALAISFDNNVIQPMVCIKDEETAAVSYSAADIESNQTEQRTFTTGTSFMISGAKWVVSAGKTAFALTVTSTNFSDGTSISTAKVIGEFYYSIKQNQSPTKGTFRLETATAKDSLLSSLFTDSGEQRAIFLGTKSAGDYMYYGAADGSGNLTASLTYDGSDVQKLGALELGTVADITVSAVDQTSAAPSVTAQDTEGDAMTAPALSWTYDPATAPEGITYNNDGTITVSRDAPSTGIRLTASSGAVTSDSVTITVTRPEAVLTSVQLSRNEVTVTGGTSAEQTVAAKAYDQFGAEINGVTWSVSDGDTANVTMSGNTVTVKAAAKAGTYTVTAQQGSVSRTAGLTVSRAAAEAAELNISGGQEDVLVPADGGAASTTAAFTAAVKDQYGESFTGAVNWTITDEDNQAVEGVSIAGGVVTVTSAAKAAVTDTTGKSFTITAVCGDTQNTAAITIKRDTPAATKAKLFRGGTELGATDTVVKPVAGGAVKTYAYTARLYDQYGVEMSGTLVWSTAEFTGNTDNKITFSDGTLTVPADAAKGAAAKLSAVIGGKSAAVTVTITDLSVDWSDIVTKPITYGEQNSAAVTLPASGTADAAGVTVHGNFTVVNPDAIQAYGSGTVTVTVQFTSAETTGDYVGVSVTRDFSITIGKRPITVKMDDQSREYGADNPELTFTINSGELVGTDTADMLGVTGHCEATAASAAGTPVEITGTAASDNYAVTVNKGTLTITKAVLTRTGEPLALGEILASAEMDADALLAAVKAKNPTLAATYCKGASQTMLEVSWALKSGTYDPKGGTYCYEGTLTPADPANFSYSGGTVTLDVAVTPVTGSVVWTVPALTKAKSEVTGAASVSALLGVGETVTVDYDHGVADGPYPITGWTPALETLKGYDVSTADKTVDVAPTVTFPAWATIDTSAMKTALTITNKFQVTVTATAPGDITYGAALGDPSASQTAGAHGTDASGTYTYCYEGSGSTDYGPSAEKPVNAGTYTVTATLVSDTHAGISAPAAFAIGKKALTEGMLTITGTYVYTGSSITPSYTVADGALLQESDYTAAVTNNVNAAKSDGASAPTVTITAAENGNYSGSLSKTFTIAPKSIAGVSVDGYSSSYTYTGAAIQPGVHVKDGGKTLVKDTDYTLRYGANTQTKDGGTITVEGKGNYTGSTQPYSFAITPAPARGIVSISGTCTVGNTVSAAVFEAEVGDAPAYQWYRDGAAIEGADQASYTLTGADAGARITVAVTAGGNYTGVLTSAAVTVGKIDIGSSGYRLDVRQEPVSSAAPAVGSTLVAQPGHTDGPQHHDPKDYDLVWARDGQELPPATPTDKYVVTKADRGHALRAKLVGKGSYTGELWSDPIRIPADRPDAPVVTAAAGSGLVTLKWTCDDAGAPITNYLLTLPDGAMVTLSGSTTGYTASGLTNGQRYTFTVRAVNGLGTGDAGSASATPTSDSGGGSWSGGSTVTTYTITVKQSVGGEIAPETTKVKRGADQTFRITPDDGCAIADVLVDGKSVGAVSKYTFENVKAAHTIQAVFEETGGSTPRVTFSDVDENGWAAEYIYFLAGREIVGGVGGGLFAPQRSITRAEFVKILAGVAGAGEAQTDSTRFTDVAPGSWYAPYVAWAVEHGVTTGTSAATFAPDDTITREQMAAMIYRYASSAGVTLPKTRDAVRFSDASGFSGWAIEAIDALTRAGILDGVGAGRFAPQESATREQACKMLALLLQIIEEA